jgi:glutamate carboxypeptidase
MTDRLSELRAHTQRMVDDLRALTNAESPSHDVDACNACAQQVAELGRALLHEAPEQLRSQDGRIHLRWRFGATQRVALVGHFDTVWPLGTLQRKPFAVTGDRAHGPGVFDMKAGIVQGVYALSTLPSSLDGVTLLLTSDEEIGSHSSRTLVEQTAGEVQAALILEPSAGDGALKIARKGVSMYHLTVHGRAAHAGLEPERGVNALTELAHRVVALSRLGNPELGTTVTPTVAQAGTTGNVVPAQAHLEIDVRALSAEEQQRVDQAVHAMPTTVQGAEVEIEGGPNRPPLPPTASAGLFERAQAVADRLHLPRLQGIAVGGGSDGNFTAAMGTPTLDGLGAVGDGAHAEHEHVLIPAMPERAALLASLVEDLLAP